MRSMTTTMSLKIIISHRPSAILSRQFAYRIHSTAAHRNSGISVLVMLPARYCANFDISSQASTPLIASPAFEPSKLASRFVLQKGRLHASWSVSTLIYAAHIQHQRANLSMSSRFLTNSHTGVGLLQFLINPQQLFVENIAI